MTKTFKIGNAALLEIAKGEAAWITSGETREGKNTTLRALRLHPERLAVWRSKRRARIDA